MLEEALVSSIEHGDVFCRDTVRDPLAHDVNGTLCMAVEVSLNLLRGYCAWSLVCRIGLVSTIAAEHCATSGHQSASAAKVH
ncbi:hypothetical protein SF12_00620 [Streptomyces sp. MBRL 601]|nr:hypothetical protein SF12_00620 [Streptomyces sp. MBRL 601]